MYTIQSIVLILLSFSVTHIGEKNRQLRLESITYNTFSKVSIILVKRYKLNLFMYATNGSSFFFETRLRTNLMVLGC